MNVPTFSQLGKLNYQIVLVFLLSLILSLPAFGQDNPTYYLIAGSFNSLESAQSGRNKIEADYGRRTELIFPKYGDKNSRYRVSIYRSSSRSEVSSFSGSLKRQGLSPGWIFEMKKPAYPSAVMRGSVATQRVSKGAYARNGVDTYYIISSSFKSFEQADRDRLAKIEEGFEAEVLKPEKEGGNYKVSVFYSSSRKQTEKYADLLKKRGTPGWIYTASSGPTSAAMTSRSDESAAKVMSTNLS
ncbi:MAG: SPOR domain-containing protein, partial [Bacteroidota bacterium]